MAWVLFDARDRFLAVTTLETDSHFTMFQFEVFGESVVALHVLGSDTQMAGVYVVGFLRHFNNTR